MSVEKTSLEKRERITLWRRDSAAPQLNRIMNSPPMANQSRWYAGRFGARLCNNDNEFQ